MSYIFATVTVVIAIFLIDRTGLWLESKGWLYYRKRKPSGGAGNALQELSAVFRPSARYSLEVKQKESKPRDDQGDQ
jgi:hypothetical protein